MTTIRVLAASASLGLLLLAGAGTAVAAPAPVDLAAARAAAGQSSVVTDLGKFFVHLDQHNAGTANRLSPQAESAAAQAKSPKLVGDALAVHTLNPAFVSGAQPTAVTEFARAAVRADSATGQHASVWLVPRGSGWEVQNVSSSVDDLTYTAQAGADTVFTEPQINAWYRISGDRVSPLNDTARGSVGAAGTTVAAYQKLVHDRYADKMAGSDYQKRGLVGGYQPTVEQGVPLGVVLPAGAAALLGVGFGLRALRRRTA
ncbi:hypothetical protein GCM10010174_78450 [Kutzneria viridogrisea]|uniref:Secreted protein n=2 Tax=Kutzneria TaxID=43356 RepID=A0ABR6BK02_9PSEU|nr:hypothetical protein [Kutzneria albida]AHH95593.1 putative secreted protein [Kutzneria albida DSM 43870]MBA8927045.1 hypothetical protein [Kutzneria viridogrisea]